MGLTPLLAPDDGCQRDFGHLRGEDRRNLFVAATLYGPAGQEPVRIRNLSRHGSLIEGRILPEEGTRVRLSRGSLSVAGTLVWRRDGRGGLRFESTVSVDDWLPRGAAAAAGVSPGQQQVDETVHRIRLGTLRAAAPAGGNGDALADLAGQLAEVRLALNAAAQALAEDQAVAMAHPAALQAIDIGVHKLERIAILLAGRR